MRLQWPWDPGTGLTRLLESWGPVCYVNESLSPDMAE